MYETLPPERRPPLDVVMAAAIRERCEEYDEKGWSLDDVRGAKDMAGQAYRFTNKMMKPAKTA